MKFYLNVLKVKSRSHNKIIKASQVYENLDDVIKFCNYQDFQISYSIINEHKKYIIINLK